MMCPHMEATLNEYVDGTLPAGDRPAVEAHLAECAGCRAAATELRRLIAEAHGLPRSIEPGRNLWTTIEARIVQRARYNVQRAFWRGAIATARRHRTVSWDRMTAGEVCSPAASS